MPGAVRPFERLKSRSRPVRIDEPGRGGTNEKTRLPEPTDLLFPKWQRELFNTILDEEKLKADRDGQARTAYSLRHTYICLRLMEGADIYQIAKNCRTSVEMIEKFYASHIKTRLDAGALNMMRKKKVAKAGDVEVCLTTGSNFCTSRVAYGFAKVLIHRTPQRHPPRISINRSFLTKWMLGS
jgi:hypothetical protein